MNRFFLLFPMVAAIIAVNSYCNATYMEGFESGDLSQYQWIDTGNGQWQVTDTNPNNGVYACQAPALGDNQNAQIETTMQCMEGVIGFSLAVSSELSHDFLYFYIDDELKGAWSGTIDYTPTSSLSSSDPNAAPYTSSVSAGEHTFKWVYSKNQSESLGQDTAWIDDIFFPINDPPQAAQVISPTDEAIIQNIDMGIPLLITGYSDPNGDPLIRVIWKVRQADSNQYFFEKVVTPDSLSLDFSLDQGLLTQNLHAGMKYFWKVGFDAENSGNTVWSKEFAFKLGTSTTDKSISIPPGMTASDFNMVSFLQWPDKPNAEAVFLNALGGTYDTRYFRIGTYDPTQGNGKYVSYGTNLTVTPGRAYWIFAKKGLDLTLNGIPVSQNIDVNVPLLYNPKVANGWNMIGCPNTPPNGESYEWNNILVKVTDPSGTTVYGPVSIQEIKDQYPENDNPYVDTRLWSWADGQYASDTSLIEKYKGYWVKAKTLNVSLIFPASTATVVTHSTKPNPVKHLSSIKWGIGVRSATADADDTPPSPMSDFRTVLTDKGEGFCFIGSVFETE